MSATKDVFNAFFNLVKTTESNSLIREVRKNSIKEVVDYNVVEVLLGQDIREGQDKFDYEHELTIYTDLHVEASKTAIDDAFLDVRELVEQAVFSVENLGLSNVFLVNFIEQSEPDYNDQAVNSAGVVRLEWMIQYNVGRE